MCLTLWSLCDMWWWYGIYVMSLTCDTPTRYSTYQPCMSDVSGLAVLLFLHPHLSFPLVYLADYWLTISARLFLPCLWLFVSPGHGHHDLLPRSVQPPQFTHSKSFHLLLLLSGVYQPWPLIRYSSDCRLNPAVTRLDWVIFYLIFFLCSSSAVPDPILLCCRCLLLLPSSGNLAEPRELLLGDGRLSPTCLLSARPSVIRFAHQNFVFWVEFLHVFCNSSEEHNFPPSSF